MTPRKDCGYIRHELLNPSEKPIATRTQAIVLIVCVIGGWGLAGPVRAAEALPKVLRQPLKMVKRLARI